MIRSYTSKFQFAGQQVNERNHDLIPNHSVLSCYAILVLLFSKHKCHPKCVFMETIRTGLVMAAPFHSVIFILK